jgi:hypothetical protein
MITRGCCLFRDFAARTRQQPITRLTTGINPLPDKGNRIAQIDRNQNTSDQPRYTLPSSGNLSSLKKIVP